jgi:histidinol dehydrogenase
VIEVIKADDGERRRLKLARVRSRSVSVDRELMRVVEEIVDEVRNRGDATLVDYALKFDGIRIQASDLRVAENEIAESAARVEPRVLQALRTAIENVRHFHDRERATSWEFQTESGVRLGQRITPVDSAGLYVPGGTASYPSSLIMNVVPAQTAGVARIAVCTPPGTVQSNPAVAAALRELRIGEVYQVGGAQAIAALAFGTETIPRVDVITGPGNKYVAAAKKLVYGAVGIDSIAGPSEVVIFADETAREDFVAADLLAQAEHGEDASAILITTSEALASKVAAEVTRQVATLVRRATILRSLAEYGAIILVDDDQQACDMVNELAPEHVEIMAANADDIAAGIRHAGAIFFGENSPEAVGDYLAGPNHVLPTGTTARFSSALGVQNFQKRTSIVRYTRKKIGETAGSIATLAEAEGLHAHARSALIRVED